MKKNVASQVVGAQMVNATTGAAFTSTVTVYVTGDGGTQALGGTGSGVCTHEGNGFHSYVPTQAETNYDHVAFTFIGTGAVPATVQLYPSFPQTGDSYARLGAPAGASIAADIATVDTVVDGIQTDLDNGTDGLGAIKADTAAILVDTAEIGTAGAGLTQVALADGAVDAGAIATGAIASGSFAAGAINAAAIGAAAITSAKFGSGAITSTVIATNAIGASQIAPDAIGASELAADAVTEIADGILKRDFSAVTGEAARSMLNALRFLRNKWTISGTTLSVTKEDDSTSAWTSTISTTPSADPVTGSDPA